MGSVIEQKRNVGGSGKAHIDFIAKAKQLEGAQRTFRWARLGLVTY